VVLTDPRFVEAEAVEVLEEIEVALEGKGRVLPHRVKRGHEDAEAQGPIHEQTPYART
jgi:hypothetical protein